MTKTESQCAIRRRGAIGLRGAIALGGFAAGFALGLAVFDPGGDESDPTDAATAPWKAELGAAPRFTDVTEASGIDFRHENGQTGEYRYLEIMGAGVALFDFDGDGRLDVYFVNGNRVGAAPNPTVQNRLYRNLGDWKFEDVTAAAGVGDASYGQGCATGDYDGDGDEDLYVTNFGPNVLYRNEGDGTFAEVAAASGVADDGWGQSASFVDYDRDGDLDLYVQNYLHFTADTVDTSFIYIGSEKTPDYPSPLGFDGSPDRLFRNEGGGRFSDVTEAAGLHQPDGKGMGLACVDFDADGLLDIFVANDTEENFYFRGVEGGRFEETGLLAGIALNASGVAEASMGVDVGDVNHDGRMDLIVPCLKRQFFTLYVNQGEYFTDESVATGMATATAQATGFNANFLDYDDDGDLDIFFANGGVRANEFAKKNATYVERYGVPDQLVANDGTGRYVDVSQHAGPYFGRALIGRGSASGDLDGDGDVDLVVCNLADRPALLRNDTTARGTGVTLELVDARGRRSPVGTRLRAKAGGHTQWSVLHPANTYLSQSDRRPHVGLGASTVIDELEITWPSGRVETLTGVQAQRVVTIREGQGAVEPARGE